MTKTRIYELAKDLNTTSKRLMEKLEEINVIVKNHMSFLEDHELKALYKHIGIVEPASEAEKQPVQEKSDTVPPPAPKKPEVKAERKDAPRIIRKTEVFLDSEGRKDDRYQGRNDQQRGFGQRGFGSGSGGGTGSGGAGGNNGKTSPYINRGDSNSGLRLGFERVVRPDYKRDTKPYGADRIEQAQRQQRITRDGGIIYKTPQAPGKEKTIVKPASSAETMAGGYVPAKKTMPPLSQAGDIPAAAADKAAATTEKAAAAVILKTAEAAAESEADRITAVAFTGITAAAADKEAADKTTSEAVTDNKPDMTDDGIEQIKGKIKPSESGAVPEITAGPGADTGDVTVPKIQIPVAATDSVAETAAKHAGSSAEPKDVAVTASDATTPLKAHVSSGIGAATGQGQRQGQINATRDSRNDGQARPQARGERIEQERSDTRISSYSTGGGAGRTAAQSGSNTQGAAGYQSRPSGTGYQSRPSGAGYQSRPSGTGDQSRPSGTGYQSRQPGTGYQQQQSGPYQQRPQGQGYQSRPQTGGTSYSDRSGTDRGRPGFRPQTRTLEIPKPELSESQKEETALNQRGETRRVFQARDSMKDEKKDQKKEVVKTLANQKQDRFNPQKIALNQKKGVSEVLSEDYILEEFYNDDGIKVKRTIKSRRQERAPKVIPPRAVLTSVTLPAIVTVKDLAETLKKTSAEVIRKLMALGSMVALNQEVDFETAAIVADEFGIKAEKQIEVTEEDILINDAADEISRLVPRSPVVVVMGHVDHGKTSLLDAIRHSNVIDSEAGGITQHIGAYKVKINNRDITFLDTPGHEAFTAMRARGAQVTDIAILVVAADDGIMPQTVEAINHAKAANVSIIVAINKIDKPGSNPEKIKQELTEYGLVSEEWGGETICVPVSAKNMQNIDRLLEMVLLTADVLELKADPDRQAKGTIIEAKLDKAKGAIATALVQRGTLNVGDAILAGTIVGRIRAMTDDRGESVISAGPSTPVEILGLPEVPEAGETFYVITDEKMARSLAEKRRILHTDKTRKTTPKVTLEDLYSQIKEGAVKELNIIVKADVQGSVEAVRQSLEKLSNSEVRVNIIHGGVGAVTESDVSLADVSNAIIIGFNVRPMANVSEAVRNAKVDMRLYSIIYNAIEDIEAAMKGMLEPTFREVVDGHAEIRQIFKISGIGTVAGCYVTDGKITRTSDVRVIRDGIVVHEGKLESLKRFKDDAREVQQGFECGLSLERYNDIRVNDIVEAYSMAEIER